VDNHAAGHSFPKYLGRSVACEPLMRACRGPETSCTTSEERYLLRATKVSHALLEGKPAARRGRKASGLQGNHAGR
jgi:hypothetical protein